MAAPLDQSATISLHETAEERKLVSSLADLAACVCVCESIETALRSGAMTDAEYTPVAQNIIKQFLLLEKALIAEGAIKDVRSFLDEYGFKYSAARVRLLDERVPATSITRGSDTHNNMKLVHDTTNALITCSDLLALHEFDVGDLRTALSAVCEALSQCGWITAEWPPKMALVAWQAKLSRMRAVDRLNEEERREVLAAVTDAQQSYRVSIERLQ